MQYLNGRKVLFSAELIVLEDWGESAIESELICTLTDLTARNARDCQLGYHWNVRSADLEHKLESSSLGGFGRIFRGPRNSSIGNPRTSLSVLNFGMAKRLQGSWRRSACTFTRDDLA